MLLRGRRRAGRAPGRVPSTQRQSGARAGRRSQTDRALTVRPWCQEAKGRHPERTGPYQDARAKGTPEAKT
eukprot:685162-Lingulodinium_polyedra.AAC.1